MDMILEKVIGVGASFLVLSLIVEKITDFVKLRNNDIRKKFTNPEDAENEKLREKAILLRSILVGVALAISLKADAVQMFISGEPGDALGWEYILFYEEGRIAHLTPENYYYFQALAFQDTGLIESLFRWVQMLIGIIITGVALSFGSKFWHDLIGILYEVKEAKARLAAKSEL